MPVIDMPEELIGGRLMRNLRTRTLYRLYCDDNSESGFSFFRVNGGPDDIIDGDVLEYLWDDE